MSIDISAHLYFPVSNTAAALKATQKILWRRKSVKGIEIITPDGEVVPIPAYTLDEGACLPGLVASLPCLAGKGPRGPINPRLDTTGGMLLRKNGKIYADVVVGIALTRGRDYMEIRFDSVTSSGVSAFQTRPFRSHLSRLFADGGGVAAVSRGMGEWSWFAEPSFPFKVPEAHDPEEAGIDAFVAFLYERL